MAYTMYPYHLTSLNDTKSPTYQPNLEETYDDPVRMARDNWVAQHTNISDSSEIIDSIDVDMIDASENANATEIYLVIDTNVLINHLPVLKLALVHIKSDPARLNIVMVVPGIVVSELDYQKKSTRSIADDSRRASSWLAEEIGSGTSRVKGQAYIQTMLPSGDWRQRSGLSNDELILDCCRYFVHVKRKDVLLCTSDNNLAVQASANATNIFFRGDSAVIRPPPRFWDCKSLLELVAPSFDISTVSAYAFDRSHPPRSKSSTADSIHASDRPHPHRSKSSTADSIHAFDRSRPPHSKSSTAVTTISSNSMLYPVRGLGAHMEIDADGDLTMQSESLTRVSPKDRRGALHRQMAQELGQHLRNLTGKAAKLQEYRREHESLHSPSNAKFTGDLPTESDWGHEWCLRDCLKFLVKIQPPQQRSWKFGDSEASSLADFLGMPGERGARPGREWAKYDWGRELLVVTNLAKDFDFEDLNPSKMAEYEHAVLAVFA